MANEEEADDGIDPLSLDPSTIIALTHLRDLLHLFHHRNKNQHRHSIWWRHFSIFRRQLNLFLSSISSLHTTAITHLQRIRKKTRDEQTRLSIQRRLEFWRDVLVAKWWWSFSQIVKDGRFAGMGLVLLAILGEVCALLGLSAELETLGDEDAFDAEDIIHEFETNEGMTGVSTALKPDQPKDRRKTVDEEDLGEVVTREDVMKDAREIVPSAKTRKEAHNPGSNLKKVTASDASNRLPSKTPSNPPKKKRKRGDAIDDIFSGFG